MVLSCLTTAAIGGRDGRRVALVYVVAVAATFFADKLDYPWASVQVAVFGVDAAFLAALWLIAIHSRSYWPIWITAFSIPTALSHVAAWLVVSHRYQIYFLMESGWSVVQLVLMPIGAWRDWEADREQPRPEFRNSRRNRNAISNDHGKGERNVGELSGTKAQAEEGP